MKYLFGFILCCLVAGLSATEQYRFRVYLKDKGDGGFRIDQPEKFLSRQAIERRHRQNIAITPTDFPISPAYIEKLASAGVRPVVQSKWFATVVVESVDSTAIERLQKLSIVDSVQWVWKGELEQPVEDSDK